MVCDAFAALATIVALAAQGASTNLSIHPVTPQPFATYQRIDWRVDIDRSYTNPFDPDDIAIDAEFSGPGGISLRVPAFWNQEFKREKGSSKSPQPLNDPGWSVRFAALQPGDWLVRISAQDRLGRRTSAPVRFKVVPGTDRGFVRRSPRSRYLQFDSGEPFFIIGFILGWGTLEEYESFLTKLSEAGGNYTRVWISPPNPVLETREAGVGRYDLAAAWHYDRILEMAHQRGVYVMLTIKNYRDLIEKDVWGDAPWPVLPYNKANGGPIAEPKTFFTDPVARKLYRQHLRYLIARYSAFTSLALWEFWNEQDNMNLGSDAEWIREMAGWLKSIDPYRHLVTTSYGAEGSPAVWNLPDVDLTQRHFYGDDGSIRDVAPLICADARRHDVYDKPHLMGELGISWRRSDNAFDPDHTTANLHTGLWASAMSGDAGGATIWWWYDYIVPHNLWGRLTPLARFAKTIPWTELNLQPVRVENPTFNTPDQQPATSNRHDLVVTAAGDWGKAAPARRVIEPGRPIEWVLPTFLYGPQKPELRTPFSIEFELASATTLEIRVARASAPCKLKVSVDDVGERVFEFAPEPEPDRAAADRIYPIAAERRRQEMPLPAGRHTMTLDLVMGDWLGLDSISLRHAGGPGDSGLYPLALSDSSTAETIAWLHDPAANWYTDSKRIKTVLFDGIVWRLRVGRNGQFKVDWWDTYAGEVVRADVLEATNGELSLRPPPFRRDIAAHIKPSTRDR